MEKEEHYTVREVVDKFKSTIDQEINVILDKENDWTTKSVMSDIVAFYELEHLITRNIIDSAKELHEALNGRSREEAPYGHKWLDRLVEAFNTHNERVDSFLKKESKLSTKVGKDDIEFFKEKLKFRNTVKSNQSKLRKDVKGLIVGEYELKELPITLHKKTKVIPLSLSKVSELKYPEIIEYVEKRKKQYENSIHSISTDYSSAPSGKIKK